jgi:undecaprenyl-diphosphatase
METLRWCDEQLFLFLNGDGGLWLDRFMWFSSGKFSWLPIYAVLLFLLYKKVGAKGLLWLLPVLVLCITANDQLASSVFKSWIQRLRPSHEPHLANLIHLVRGANGEFYIGGKYGFYSSHAANNAGVLTMVLLLIRPIKKWLTAALIGWVVLIGYSRIYLGVHYPGDILMGFGMGTILGLVFYYLYLQIPEKWRSKT